MALTIDNLTVENSIDAPLSSQVTTALADKYDVTNPAGYQTAAQVTTAANGAVTTANNYTDGKVAALVAASPTTLDTLNELAAALGNDANFAATTSTALGNRLRVDTAAQGLNGTQKTNAKTNLDLQNVENTSDLNKVVSTATQTALNGKANLSHTHALTDLTQTGATNGQVVTWNGSSWVASTPVTGFNNHGDFPDLADDDHTQYHNDTRGDARYYTKTLLDAGQLDTRYYTQAEVDTLLNAKANNVLTGLSLADSSDVVATDTVLQGIGKLQAQSNLWTELFVANQVQNASNTTLVSITDLEFPVTNGKRYRIECMLMIQSANTAVGFRPTLALNGATGELAAISSVPQGNDGTGSIFISHITASGDVGTSTSTAVANQSLLCTIEGVFVCTTSGTIVPQFRSETNGTTVTVRAGSNILVREF